MRVVGVLVRDQQRGEALPLAGGFKYDIGRGRRLALDDPGQRQMAPITPLLEQSK